MTAGARIKSEADRQNISIRRLSEITGVGFGTVQGIVTGAREPKLSHLFLIADALGVGIGKLIGSRATDRAEAGAA